MILFKWFFRFKNRDSFDMGYQAGFLKALEIMDVFKELNEKAKDRIRQEAIDSAIKNFKK